MPDFVSPTCDTCTQLQFYTYTESCDVLDADIQAIGLTLCGYNVDCLTIEADYTALQPSANEQFVVIKGVSGTKADPTPVEVDLSSYSCYPSRFIKEYDEVLNFSVPFITENYNFWNQIRQNPDIASQAMYVSKSGIVFEIPSAPSIFVSLTQENGIWVASGSIEWTTNSLEQPFIALSNIWAC